MKNFFKLLILTFLLHNCSTNRSSQSVSFNQDKLIGHWVHSHEDDYDDIKVYRLSSYQFPPSRGREKIVFKSNAVLEYTPIAPNDLPQTFNGEWKIDKSDLILEYDDNKKIYEIIEVTSSILKLK